MTNITSITQPGRNNLAGVDTALFLDKFSGEVLTVFDKSNIMLPLSNVKRITEGRSFQWPRIGRTEALYHAKGENLMLDSNGYLKELETTAVTIQVDKPLISTTFIDNWDALLSHYDYRAEVAKQLGESLSDTIDSQLMRLVALAAEEATPFAGAINADVKGATVEISAAATETIKDGIRKATVALKRNNVRADDIVVAVSPEDYMALLMDDSVSSYDYASSANSDRSEGRFLKLFGVKIVETNRLGATGIGGGTFTADAGELNDYVGVDGDFTDVRALMWHKDAIGTVLRQDIMSEAEYRMDFQGTQLLTKMVAGHGILRGECAVKIIDVA